MSVLRHLLRVGSYHDSIVLMQLRAALEEEPGVAEAGAVMGTPENLELLEASALLPDLPEEPGPSDLLVVVRGESEAAAAAALDRVDELLRRERAGTGDGGYRPRSLEAAVRLLPAARWVLVSVPGRFAAGVARKALELDRHVFLFSDSVPIEEEVRLKREAGARGLLVMGPDCGTAIIRGVGFGFANRVRRGEVGIVAASGTGLQAVACGIHARGGGISHAIGTGGRDLATEVGGTTSLQALDLLSRDPETRAIVLVSKPPAPAVADRLLAAAAEAGKPVVARFLGVDDASGGGPVRFARSLGQAAAMAVELSSGAASCMDGTQPGRRAGSRGVGRPSGAGPTAAAAPVTGWLRGLFAGGTLALETLGALERHLPRGSLHSNLNAPGAEPLPDPWRSRAHTILDLGADEFTSGRPHPMLDEDLRIRRLGQEAADPGVALVLLDVVLGDGVHPDPAAGLAPAIEAASAGHELEVAVILIGTDEDPQDVEAQTGRLEAAGALVFRDPDEALEHVRRRLAAPAEASRDRPDVPGGAAAPDGAGAVEAPEVESVERVRVGLEALSAPVAAINVGLEAFHASLVAREVRAVHVDWRPPAAGDEKLASILERLSG